MIRKDFKGDLVGKYKSCHSKVLFSQKQGFVVAEFESVHPGFLRWKWGQSDERREMLMVLGMNNISDGSDQEGRNQCQNPVEPMRICFHWTPLALALGSDSESKFLTLLGYSQQTFHTL